jgi:hypothetical protein
MKWILLLLLLLPMSAFADDLYLVTISFENGKATITDTTAFTGNAPQHYGGGTYLVKDESGGVVGQGNFAYPTEMIMERFEQDNSITGERAAVESIVVIVPASAGAATLELKDPAGTSLGVTAVPKAFDDIEGGSDFFLKYAWVFLLILILLVIALLSWGVVRIIKKFTITPPPLRVRDRLFYTIGHTEISFLSLEKKLSKRCEGLAPTGTQPHHLSA